MEVVVTGHPDGLSDAGACEIEPILATASVENEVGLGRINQTGEIAIASEVHVGVAGQAPIGESQGAPVLVYDAVAANRSSRSGDIHVEASPRRNYNGAITRY